jgi:hypothetical protein
MGFSPRVQLASATGRDFERLVLPYLQFVFPDLVQPTPLATWDRKGVDFMTTPERDPIEVCVQCKSTVKPRFDLADIDEFRNDVRKFIESGARCDRYILALNRNDFDGEIFKGISDLVRKLSISWDVEVWELGKIIKETENAIKELIQRRVAAFNDEWRIRLVGRFAPSGAWVRRVPASVYRMMLSWENDPEIRGGKRSTDIEIGPYLLRESGPHMALLIGDDGIGKTSAALMASQERNRTVIYVPASSLNVPSSQGTSVLARAIGDAIDVQPETGEDTKLFRFFVGRGLAQILREDEAVTLVIDGLDESRVFRGFNGLRFIRSQLKGMRCKIILSTRTKHFDLRAGDFSQGLQDRGKAPNRKKGIQVVELCPWTQETIINHINDIARTLPKRKRDLLTKLRTAIEERKTDQLYGNLLSHPIFLDLIVDDVANGKIQTSTRSSLVRNWILRKIRRDQSKYQSTPLRGDVTQEMRLVFRALEDIALEMSVPGTRIPIERINHTRVRRILLEYELTDDEIFELILKSVLVAVGQTTTFRDASIKFSHRVFHEYMIASCLKRTNERPSQETPSEITDFFNELKEEAQDSS